ncbi:FkbM family methyltransferase [Sphingobium sp. HWE2-09]|uniref:FkbM family methyltransferase n=1 Tax=Sphingobium sp. HWE2-09 TaxID=3108390 RepID=UPI002DCF1569|nr:FkbM family methyltransferase [Sphingobium sp. HWE2-09]
MSLSYRLKSLREMTGHPLNQGKPLQTLGRYLKWNIGRRLIDVEYVMPMAQGTEIILSNAENYATLSYTGQMWDFPEMMFLVHFLRADDLFVDIGANVGAYSVLAGAVGMSRVIAVEPVPQTYAKLQRNLRLNGVGERAELLNIGLADQAGTLHFTTDRGGLNHVVDSGGIAVPVRTLDDVLAGRSANMIKLDVEGFEVEVLRGGAACLATPDLRAIVVELNGSGERYGHPDAEVDAILVEAGFAPHLYDPVTRSLTRAKGFNTEGLNTLYCRPDDPSVASRVKAAPKVRVRDREI